MGAWGPAGGGSRGERKEGRFCDRRALQTEKYRERKKRYHAIERDEAPRVSEPVRLDPAPWTCAWHEGWPAWPKQQQTAAAGLRLKPLRLDLPESP